MIDIYKYIIEAFNNAKGGDEFYTYMKDIEKELSNYKFNNKIVYCNCDNPSKSNFYKYFKENFKSLGIKLLYSTYYSDEPELTIFNGDTEEKHKIKSGDFRDNTDILKKCDIVVTNPPYSNSLPIELIKLCIKYNKDFLFLGPLHLITNKYIFQLFKENKLNLGINAVNRFYGVNNEYKRAPTCWYTSIYIEKPKMQFTQKYSEDKYEKFDNYDAINCTLSKDIPEDYKGNIGTSIDFARKLNRNQFDIIDIKTPIINGNKKYKKLIIKFKG